MIYAAAAVQGYGMTGIDNRITFLCYYSTFRNHESITHFRLHLKSAEVG